MSRLGLDVTPADLAALGYTVQGGVCVPVAQPKIDMPHVATNVPEYFTVQKLGGPERKVHARYGLAPNGRAYKSKWECEYAGWLETEKRTWGIAWWSYECFKLRLADGAYFTPDFPVVTSGGQLVMREVKGHWREAARLRVKVAASQFPWLRIEIISKQKGQWHLQETFNA